MYSHSWNGLPGGNTLNVSILPTTWIAPEQNPNKIEGLMNFFTPSFVNLGFWQFYGRKKKDKKSLLRQLTIDVQENCKLRTLTQYTKN